MVFLSDFIYGHIPANEIIGAHIGCPLSFYFEMTISSKGHFGDFLKGLSASIIISPFISKRIKHMSMIKQQGCQRQ